MDQSAPNWLINMTGRTINLFVKHKFNSNIIDNLRTLINGNYEVDLSAANSRGWKLIRAETGGQLDEEDQRLLALWLNNNKINTVYATSLYEIERSKEGWVLVISLDRPNAYDFYTLEMGGWMYEEYANSLIKKDLWWHKWRQGFYFDEDLSFILVRVVDAYGHCTIAGPKNLSDFIKTYSHHKTYEWNHL